MVGPRMLDYLGYVARHPACGAPEFGEAFMVPAGHASATVSKMIGRGLLVRVPAGQGGRFARVQITGEGMQVLRAHETDDPAAYVLAASTSPAYVSRQKARQFLCARPAAMITPGTTAS